ncbi:MAG: RNA polymerase sigma-70 factor [Bacteroidetes bacterium]|nr:RNA polymerase sigma-70 factor [Bacteroidota bacterium]
MLYRRYSSVIFHTAFTYLKEREKAKDIIQVIFIKLWEKRALLPAIDHFENYLFILVRNTLLDQLKKTALESRSRLQLERTPSSFVNDSDHLLLDREYTRLLRSAVANLPPQQRQVYTLAREQHLTYEEIAGKMQLSRATVKKHMELALRAIRNQLLDHF